MRNEHSETDYVILKVAYCSTLRYVLKVETYLPGLLFLDRVQPRLGRLDTPPDSQHPLGSNRMKNHRAMVELSECFRNLAEFPEISQPPVKSIAFGPIYLLGMHEGLKQLDVVVFFLVSA